MDATSQSLLDRLKDGADPAAWGRLQELYAPLIRRWITRMPGLTGAVDDLTQDVMLVLVRKVGDFERRREGSFRAWLRIVTVNRVRAYCRARGPAGRGGETEAFLTQLEDPAADLSRDWDADHDRHVFRQLLATVAGDFQPATWAAFEKVTFHSVSAAQAAAELGLTENAVLLAKSRILRRLREDARGLID